MAYQKWWWEATSWRSSRALHFLLKCDCSRRKWRRQQVTDKREANWQSEKGINEEVHNSLLTFTHEKQQFLSSSEWVPLIYHNFRDNMSCNVVKRPLNDPKKNIKKNFCELLSCIAAPPLKLQCEIPLVRQENELWNWCDYVFNYCLMRQGSFVFWLELVRGSSSCCYTSDCVRNNWMTPVWANETKLVWQSLLTQGDANHWFKMWLVWF